MPYRLSSWRLFALVMSVFALGMVSQPTLSNAGCGCEKPPPAPASVRPSVTYQGMPVTLIHSSLIVGQTYNVTFSPMTGPSTTVSAMAVSRRDLADGMYKPQLVVNLPSLPLGPVSITVKQGKKNAILAIPDTNFTVAPRPISVPSQVGSYQYANFRAAISRDGVVYVSFDVSAVTQPRTFRAQPKGHPLRFTVDDIAFYNTQGVLMQLINQGIPGLASIKPSSTADGNALTYSRHEFNTYFLQHAENHPHTTDPTDGNWHLDGSRHVDHNHLILAIAGTVNGNVPPPGASPAFTLELRTATFFDNGLVGIDSVAMTNNAKTTSFTSIGAWTFNGGQGDVLSNGPISLNHTTLIDGDAAGAPVTLLDSAVVTGATTTITQPALFLPVSIPTDLTNLGSIALNSTTPTRVLTAGSYLVSQLTIATGGSLVINNLTGPVTLYVTGAVQISGNGSVTTTDPNPEKFAIYVSSNADVQVSDSGNFYGVLYAPQSLVQLSGWSTVYGALVGKTMWLQDNASLSYDTVLREGPVLIPDPYCPNCAYY